MASSKTIIQNSPSRTTIKIVGAAADTSTINLKAAVTLTSISGNLVFTAGTNGTATITTTGGSRATDMPIPVVPGVTTVNGTQYFIDCTNVAAASASNRKVFSVIGIATNVLTVLETITTTETVAYTGVTAYSSDVGFAGQGISGTPSVAFDVKYYSVAPLSGATTAVTVTRNSVLALNLSGGIPMTGLVFNENSTSNIVAAFAGGAGTLVLECIKSSGFDRTFQSLDPQ